MASVFTTKYVTRLKTLRDGILDQLAADGSSALWDEYEIRNRRVRRMTPLEGVEKLNKMIATAESQLDSMPARNQGRPVWY